MKRLLVSCLIQVMIQETVENFLMNSVALLPAILHSSLHLQPTQAQRSMPQLAITTQRSFPLPSSPLTPLPSFLQATPHKCLLLLALQISAHPDRLVILKFAPALNKRMAKLIWRERYLEEGQRREFAQLLIPAWPSLHFDSLSQEF